MNRKTYQVDAAMMGQEWSAPVRCLREFCTSLQARCDAAKVDVDVECVVDSGNGAHNEDPYLVPEALWMEALDALPAHYWREGQFDDESIEKLRAEAGQHGDMEQVALCDRALDGDWEALFECSEVLAEAEVEP